MLSLALHGAAFGCLWALSALEPIAPDEPLPITLLVEPGDDAPSRGAEPKPPAPRTHVPAPSVQERATSRGAPARTPPPRPERRRDAPPARPPADDPPAAALASQDAPASAEAGVDGPGAAEAALPSAAGGGAAGDVAAAGPAGASGPGRAGDASGSADAEAVVAAYIQLVRGRIEERKRYPALARSRHVQGIVIALVHLEAAGLVSAVEILDSPSGLLSEPTRTAILAAGPFPPPPGQLRRIRIPLRYAID